MPDFLVHLLIFLVGGAVGLTLHDLSLHFPYGAYLPEKALSPPLSSTRPRRGALTALTTASLFLAILVTHRGAWEAWPAWGATTLLHSILISFLVLGSLIDLDHFLLPHEVTFGGLAVGLAGSALAPGHLQASTSWSGFTASVVGACAGALLIWLVIQLGKLAFGRQRILFQEPQAWSITQPDAAAPPVFTIGEDSLPWEDLFFRPTDRLLLDCTRLTIDQQHFGPCELTVWQDKLKVAPGDGSPSAQRSMESVAQMGGSCVKVTIPREAMGYGGLFLLAMIGSFLGWQGALFTLVGASFLGSAIPLLAAAISGGKNGSTKIPFGPYLSAAAVIWVLWRESLLSTFEAVVLGSGT